MTTVPVEAVVERPTTTRLMVCYAAIASALPYLVLKILWVSGSTVGITDPEFAEDGSLLALNLLTLLMDAVAILLVLAFTYRWGLRLPAWLVLLPIFVGSGLLGPIAVGAPVALVATAVSGGEPDSVTDLPLEGWVIPLVYGGFVVLGVLLLTAFLLYARARWFEVFSDRTPGLPMADRVLAAGGTLLALVAAALLVADAFEPGEVVSSAVSLSAVKALLALAAAAGVWALHPTGRRRFLLPMLAAWVGSAALLAWGGWSLLNTLGGTALVTAEVGPRAIVGGLAQFLGGVLLAVVLVQAQRRVTGAAAPW
ncbi:MAG: hypothetical protein ACRDQB_07185 [Thermocrispum sp.]